MDFAHAVGFLSGLHWIRPDMEFAVLWRTLLLVHALDAILCRVLARQRRRREWIWTALGLLFGFWALAALLALGRR